MNLRMIVFSGIMCALIGAMIGLAISKIAQRETRTKIIIVAGGTLGFLVGSAYEGVNQQQKERYKDE